MMCLPAKLAANTASGLAQDACMLVAMTLKDLVDRAATAGV